jgi:hypothetical protein
VAMRAVGVSPGGVHLVRQLLHSVFSQLSSASRSAALRGNGG